MENPDEDRPRQDQPVEGRLVALETRLAHYEKMADEMSDCLLEQGRTIDLLRRRVAALRERLGDLESGWRSSPQDEKPPPHY